MRLPSPIKALFQNNNARWDYYNRHKNHLRPAITDNIIKILGCGLMSMGYKTYTCSNDQCHHIKHITFSCKSRFCPTCGKRATDIWINKQLEILPKTNWQHITFTMPSILWPCFAEDRTLLNQIANAAADCIITLAKKRGIKVAVFTALHTFGRGLNWHVHIHLSVTMGGLTKDLSEWKAIRFSKKAVMPMWRKRVIALLRAARKNNRITMTYTCLEVQYHKNWIVHFAKPTKTPWKTIAYLGRYLKKPPLSMARLKHYDGRNVTFQYLNHKTKTNQQKTLDTDEFFNRFTQHIPDKGFRLIRYFGILANRVRGTLLPIAYQLLNQITNATKYLGFKTLMINSFGIDPKECILCGATLRFAHCHIGLNTQQLKNYHDELATRKPIM